MAIIVETCRKTNRNSGAESVALSRRELQLARLAAEGRLNKEISYTLGLTEGTDYHRLNAIKQILAVIIQAVAIVIFIRGGIIAWPAALVTMAAAVAGGYLGVGVARKVPGGVMRGFVIASGAALTIYYFFST